jgi:hypothetical protein
VVRKLEWVFEFPARFEVQELDELPGQRGTTEVFYFPGATPGGRATGPMLRIAPSRPEPWIGLFHCGDYLGGHWFPPARRYLIGWPDEESFCVVCGGLGCVARANEPKATFEIEAHPITDVLVVPERRLVVFANFTDLIAYRSDGVIWRSGRLVTDDLRIIRADGDTLYVAGYYLGHRGEFGVDLRTGESERELLD